MKGTARILLVAIAVSVAGCSSFQRDWKRAALAPSVAGFEGRWEGRWESDRNQHDGALRCVVTCLTNDVYSARFHARYWRLFTFGYTAVLQAKAVGDQMTFSGEADIGWYGGGIYRYEGHVGATNFFSTYSSKHDYGTFIMTRPPAAAEAR